MGDQNLNYRVVGGKVNILVSLFWLAIMPLAWLLIPRFVMNDRQFTYTMDHLWTLAPLVLPAVAFILIRMWWRYRKLIINDNEITVIKPFNKIEHIPFDTIDRVEDAITYGNSKGINLPRYRIIIFSKKGKQSFKFSLNAINVSEFDHIARSLKEKFETAGILFTRSKQILFYIVY